MADYANFETIDERRRHERGCPVHAYQHVHASVPVSVVPYARVGKINIRCTGNTAVSSDDSRCSGTKDGVCNFIVSQSFCVEIPINFGASVNIGDTFVEALGTSSSDGNNEDDCNDNILL